MSGITEIQFTSWDHFKAQYSEYLPARRAEQDFVYRGQASDEWKLTTSFTRSFGTGKDTWDMQRELLTAFMREADLFRQPAGFANVLDRLAQYSKPISPLSKKSGAKKLLDDCIKIWAHGQHYGLPTPLLDWTSSPYIAAFFAYESAFKKYMGLSKDEIWASKHRVAVFALNRTEAVKSEVWEKMGVALLEDYGSVENTRIKNQRGLFTLLPPPYSSLDDCLAEYLRTTKDRRPLLVKFSLPYSDAPHAIADLALMDISARRIYNDWDGVCSAANMSCWLLLHRRISGLP